MKIATTRCGSWGVTEFGDGSPALPGSITCHLGRPRYKTWLRPMTERSWFLCWEGSRDSGAANWKRSMRTPLRHATQMRQYFSGTAMGASGLEPMEPVLCISIRDAPTYFHRLMDSLAITLCRSSKIAKVMFGSPPWAGSIVFATTRSQRTPNTKAWELRPDGVRWRRAKMEVYGWAPKMV